MKICIWDVMPASNSLGTEGLGGDKTAFQKSSGSLRVRDARPPSDSEVGFSRSEWGNGRSQAPRSSCA